MSEQEKPAGTFHEGRPYVVQQIDSIFPESSRTHGMWWVGGKPPIDATEPYSSRYLHHDGQWRETATNDNNELTGYYQTQADAQAALDKALSEGNVPKA